MFDPTVYDNLKVVLEGALYDLDLAGQLEIIGRSDRVELSTMSRFFQLDCKVKPDGIAVASVSLDAGLADLAAEILEQEGKQPGCHCYITFQIPVDEPLAAAEAVKTQIREIWGERPLLKMTVSYSPDTEQPDFMLLASMHFGRKLDEGQMEDIPSMIDHVALTLQTLDGYIGQRG
ncbi:hypothetical protein [Paenibacillus thalictri]|uniref:Uncharacterized protein n=1 Tax=Paenibacillus thalictri TaxID=2527873 RepID=A0A4Q9DTL9_9BACL|nr:hypothetical protein [Paenibacillus thalictri]TBL80258.1 hypothetical protein EYB31_07520 [Paenibacillus thalictri]